MTADRVIELARSQIGVTENPPNSNNVIYNTWYYGHPVNGSASPWCCTFIEWLFKSEPNLIKRTASCSDLLKWCRANALIVDKPQVGDLVFFNFNNPNVLAQHIGIVDKPKGAKDIYSIEGNTSEKGSQDNGGAVLRKHRTGKCIVAYARPRYVEGKITNITNHKSNEEIAKEVIQGKWGMANDRRQRLSNAGYNYQEIQKLVNQILKG